MSNPHHPCPSISVQSRSVVYFSLIHDQKLIEKGELKTGQELGLESAMLPKSLAVTKISLSANTREDGDVTTGWGAPKRLGWEASRTARGGGNCSFLPDSVFPYHTAPAAPPGAGLNIHHPGCSVRLWPPPALILVDPRVHSNSD